MNRCIILALVLSLMFLGCSSEEGKSKNKILIDTKIEVCENIETSTFSQKNTILINEDNFKSFSGLVEKNPELVNDFLQQGGKLVVKAQEEILQVVEKQLLLPICRDEQTNVDTKCKFIMFCGQDEKINCREILVENDLNYSDKEIVQLAVAKVAEEVQWQKVEVNGPEYVGAEGYIYIGDDLLFNVRHDLFMIQDSMGFDTYFVVANIAVDTSKSSVELETSLTSSTNSMTWVAAEPCGITPENADEVKLMAAGGESIVWKQDVESMVMESYTMSQGELWKIISKDDTFNFRMGIILDCPMSKTEVKFLSKLLLIEDDGTKMVEDIFSYTIN